MKTIVFLLLMISLPLQAGVIDSYKQLEEAKDYLGLRILLKKRLPKIKKNYKEWSFARSVLNRNPAVGLDMFNRWDRVAPKRKRRSKVERKINRYIVLADKLMLKEKFKKSAKVYQKLAKFLKKEINKGKIKNNFLYFYTLHSLGRALYGNGQFKDANRVYGWIPAVYPNYQQVLFERMWSGFRSGRIDLANGALASLSSSYFSEFLPPESYLLQMYIYKRLCREKEVKVVRNNIQKYIKVLEKGDQSYSDWAKSDLENLALYRLAVTDPEKGRVDIISQKDRVKEKKRLKEKIVKRFKEAKPQLLENLNKILGLSFLASSASAKTLPPAPALEGYGKLLERGYEMWPVQDAEDWLDELGRHRFIGKNKCK